MDFPLQELIEGYPKAIAGICGGFVFLLACAAVQRLVALGNAARAAAGPSKSHASICKPPIGKPHSRNSKPPAASAYPPPTGRRPLTSLKRSASSLQRRSCAEGKAFEMPWSTARAAQILGEQETDVRINVQDAMLHEIRRLFSKTGETDAAMDLVVRTLLVQSPCREASFWQAMCEIRLACPRCGIDASAGRADG